MLAWPIALPVLEQRNASHCSGNSGLKANNMILCVNGRADGPQREHEVSGNSFHKSLVVQSYHRKWRSLAKENPCGSDMPGNLVRLFYPPPRRG
jgi:hypothetical protein